MRGKWLASALGVALGAMVALALPSAKADSFCTSGMWACTIPSPIFSGTATFENVSAVDGTFSDDVTVSDDLTISAGDLTATLGRFITGALGDATTPAFGLDGGSSGLYGDGPDVGVSVGGLEVARFTEDPGLVVAGLVRASTFLSTTNCSSSAAPAACSAAQAGSVVIAAAGTTVTVNTSSVTANSQIFIQEDSSLGTRLSVTCNTTTGRDYTVTARTAATSFVITASAAPVTNPACLSYFIVN